MAARWSLRMHARAQTRLRNIPDEIVRARLAARIALMASAPHGPQSTCLDAPQAGRRRVRKIAEGQWRVICVLLPVKRAIHVVDAFRRHDSPDDYSKANFRRWLRSARGNPERLHTILDAHPDWSDARTASEAGCSDSTVARRRKEWHIPARHQLPWRPWEGRR